MVSDFVKYCLICEAYDVGWYAGWAEVRYGLYKEKVGEESVYLIVV